VRTGRLIAGLCVVPCFVALLLSGCAHSPAPVTGGTTEASPAAVPSPGQSTREARRARRAKDDAADVAAGAVALPEALAQRHADALAAIEAGHHEEAEAALEEVIAAAPELTGPRINLALLYVRTGRLAEAQSALEQALALRPASAAAETQLGVVLRMRGRFAEAEQAYLAALAADPAYANAHYNIGVLYDLYLQRPADALSHYEQYQSLSGAADEQVAKWIADLTRRHGGAKTAEASGE
jgi:tetratricopeptide (TPR) repeat protein